MPVEIGRAGILRVIEPSLTHQERTRMENAIEMVQKGFRDGSE
jgi:malate/lactate dehydrogenase